MTAWQVGGCVVAWGVREGGHGRASAPTLWSTWACWQQAHAAGPRAWEGGGGTGGRNVRAVSRGWLRCLGSSVHHVKHHVVHVASAISSHHHHIVRMTCKPRVHHTAPPAAAGAGGDGGDDGGRKKKKKKQKIKVRGPMGGTAAGIANVRYRYAVLTGCMHAYCMQGLQEMHRGTRAPRRVNTKHGHMAYITQKARGLRSSLAHRHPQPQQGLPSPPTHTTPHPQSRTPGMPAPAGGPRQRRARRV